MLRLRLLTNRPLEMEKELERENKDQRRIKVTQKLPVTNTSVQQLDKNK